MQPLKRFFSNSILCPYCTTTTILSANSHAVLAIDTRSLHTKSLFDEWCYGSLHSSTVQCPCNCLTVFALLQGVHEKNYNTVYVVITLTNESDFNKILHQHCEVKLQAVTKFQQNRSKSATATASLVRSLKSISVHYRHTRDWLSSVSVRMARLQHI